MSDFLEINFSGKPRAEKLHWNEWSNWNFNVFTLAISKCYGKVRVLFFPRDISLISRGNSHVSRVRGLVVRCLLFNPEVTCSNPWVCADFFASIPKQKVLTFFGTMRLFGFARLFSALWDFFSKFFKCPQRVLLSIFLISCNRTNVIKSQRVPFSHFSALCDLAETSKKIRKVFSQFLVLKDRFFKDRSFFYATFLKFVFTEAPAQFLQETKRFARGLLKALRLTRDHQKCFRKILNFFLFSV